MKTMRTTVSIGGMHEGRHLDSKSSQVQKDFGKKCRRLKSNAQKKCTKTRKINLLRLKTACLRQDLNLGHKHTRSAQRTVKNRAKKDLVDREIYIYTHCSRMERYGNIPAHERIICTQYILSHTPRFCRHENRTASDRTTGR